MDVYFLISAAGLPERVIKEIATLNKEELEFAIFVDTNVIYSILGLHDNPSNQAANDLKALVRIIKDNIVINFFITYSTLEETQKSITYHKTRLSGVSYPPNLAEAVTAMDIYGVYRTFFERVQSSGRRISAEEYFEPYENNLMRLLEGNDVQLFPAAVKKYDDIPDVSDDIEAQIKFERVRHGSRAKSEPKIVHDVTLWHFVQDQRSRINVSPLQSKCWVVTLDYRFLAFDKFKSKQTSLLPACMHPSQLIQLLRFFVPRSPDLEKALLGVMKFPITSREFDTKAEQISLKITSILARHEGIEDISVPTLTTLLADSILRDRLSNSRITKEEEIEEIQNTLTRIVAEKDTLLEKQRKEILQINEYSAKVKTNEIETRKTADRAIKEIEKIEDDKTAVEADLIRTKKELSDVQEDRDRYKLIIKIILSIIFVALGIGIIFWLPALIPWPWLENHIHKLGLQLCATYCWLGLLWMIIDKKRRRFAFGSIVIASVIALTQIA